MSLPQILCKAEVYFNGAKTPVDFWLQKDNACLGVLMSKLNDLLLDRDYRKLSKNKLRGD